MLVQAHVIVGLRHPLRITTTDADSSDSTGTNQHQYPLQRNSIYLSIVIV